MRGKLLLNINVHEWYCLFLSHFRDLTFFICFFVHFFLFIIFRRIGWWCCLNLYLFIYLFIGNYNHFNMAYVCSRSIKQDFFLFEHYLVENIFVACLETIRSWFSTGCWCVVYWLCSFKYLNQNAYEESTHNCDWMKYGNKM